MSSNHIDNLARFNIEHVKQFAHLFKDRIIANGGDIIAVRETKNQADISFAAHKDNSKGGFMGTAGFHLNYPTDSVVCDLRGETYYLRSAADVERLMPIYENNKDYEDRFRDEERDFAKTWNAGKLQK